ncbi:MAG: hypothetical protein EOP00_01010 [Pedobacter sp.]|nr:MAG: hypothetical protein EOP00_01010 [Pedobacter sp.]
MGKNFLEMLDDLQSEQKQPFIDHFVQTVLGKAASPLIMSTTKTISNDASVKERIRLTAEIYGIDPKRIDRKEFLLGEQQIAESKIQIKDIIKEHFGKANNTGQRSKDDELISLGKFLYTTQMKFDILSMESPDFIFKSANLTIGLEHTRLEAGYDKAYIAEIWKKYLNDTLSILKHKSSKKNGLINLTLDTDYKLFNGKSLRDFNDKSIKDNSMKIIAELADFMVSAIEGKPVVPPNYIKSFSYQPSNEPLSLRYNQDYFVRNDFTEMVLNAVKKKQIRLSAYKSNNNIKDCWLLLVFDNSSLSSGFKINEYSLTSSVESDFDRIFILNAFNLACFEVEKGSSNLRYIAKKQFLELTIKPLNT